MGATSTARGSSPSQMGATPPAMGSSPSQMGRPPFRKRTIPFSIGVSPEPQGRAWIRLPKAESDLPDGRLAFPMARDASGTIRKGSSIAGGPRGKRTHLLQNGIERDQDPFESGKVAASAPEDGSSPSEMACRASRKASGGRKANPGTPESPSGPEDWIPRHPRSRRARQIGFQRLR